MKRAATSFGGLVQAEARERRQRHDFPGSSASVAAAPRTERLLLGGALVVAIGALFVPQAHGTVNPEPDPYPSGATARRPPGSAPVGNELRAESPAGAGSRGNELRAEDSACSGAHAGSGAGAIHAWRDGTGRVGHRPVEHPPAASNDTDSNAEAELARDAGGKEANADRASPNGRQEGSQEERRRRSPLLRSRRPRRPPTHDHWPWRGWRSSRWFWRARACCTS